MVKGFHLNAIYSTQFQLISTVKLSEDLAKCSQVAKNQAATASQGYSIT